MPTTIARAIAKTTSSIVAGRRESTSESDGWPCTKEMPRSPSDARATNRKYCWCRGRSSPSDFTTCWIDSGEALGLENTWTGLPSM